MECLNLNVSFLGCHFLFELAQANSAAQSAAADAAAAAAQNAAAQTANNLQVMQAAQVIISFIFLNLTVCKKVN